jgi:hypothetical protein
LPSSFFLERGALVKRVAVFVAQVSLGPDCKSTLLERKTRSFVHVGPSENAERVCFGQVEIFAGQRSLRIIGTTARSNRKKSYEHECIERSTILSFVLAPANIKRPKKLLTGLLIADLIGLAQKQVHQRGSIILSGDADLVAGVIAVQNLGIRVLLIEIGAREATSTYLIAEVDRYCRWNR